MSAPTLHLTNGKVRGNCIANKMKRFNNCKYYLRKFSNSLVNDLSAIIITQNSL